MSQPTYVIASTPRSGSSLLAAGLVRTGVAGRPEEYFTPDHIGSYKEDLNLPMSCSSAEYLAKVMAFAATPNGVRVSKFIGDMSSCLRKPWVFMALRGSSSRYFFQQQFS